MKFNKTILFAALIGVLLLIALVKIGGKDPLPETQKPDKIASQSTQVRERVRPQSLNFPEPDKNLINRYIRRTTQPMMIDVFTHHIAETFPALPKEIVADITECYVKGVRERVLLEASMAEVKEVAKGQYVITIPRYEIGKSIKDTISDYILDAIKDGGVTEPDRLKLLAAIIDKENYFWGQYKQVLKVSRNALDGEYSIDHRLYEESSAGTTQTTQLSSVYKPSMVSNYSYIQALIP